MCKAGTDFNDCCQTIDRDWECTYEPYPSPPSNIGREVNTTCACIVPLRTEPQPAWLMCKAGTDFNDCCQTIDRDWDCTYEPSPSPSPSRGRGREVNTSCACTIPPSDVVIPVSLMCKAGTDFNDCCQKYERDWDCTFVS